MKYAIIALSLLTSLSFAQESVASALDSIEENVIGFALNGHAKAGMARSVLNSKAFTSGEDSSEYSAFTDFTLGISIRPSNETKATFDLRFHKDWQSAYREGNNSPIIRWWSYDGNILDKKLKFNLGTMRLAYTPLTIYLPEPEAIMEPEIFSDMKKDAMEERYLDGTNRRLLQGLNVEFAMPIGIFDNIFIQGTIARLRKVADNVDRVFFDFDTNKDRYSAAARIGVEAQGISLKVSDVNTFNRYSSSLKNMSLDDTVNYEKNNVLSFELKYNSKKLLNGPIGFDAGVEYALSSWDHKRHVKVDAEPKTDLAITTIDRLIPGYSGSGYYYTYYKTAVPGTASRYELEDVDLLENKGALLANASVSFNQEPFEAKLLGNFLKVDKEFEAELAASPAYLPRLPIWNSSSDLGPDLQYLGQFRAGSLENMYYSLYYTLPLNAITIISGRQGRPIYNDVIRENACTGARPSGSDLSLYQSACLDNNYKLAQYYRNAYTQQTYTRWERMDSSFISRIDPASNLALPYGYATPDRQGGGADFNFAWNKAVNFRGVFGKYSSEAANYTRFGGGLDVNIAKLVDFSKALTLTGSYEQNKEENGRWNPTTNRIMAGFKAGIWRGLSLIGGFQQLAKEFGTPYEIVNEGADYFAINKTSEMLAIGGPQIKISERADFTLQGGLLTNAVTYTTVAGGIEETIDLDKFIVSGMVTVDF